MAISLFLENFRGFEFVETPKDRPADIDGFLVKEGVVVSGVEVKCRNMTVHDLETKYDMKWMITANKLDRGVNICKGLEINFWGFLYLVPDNMLFIVPVFSPKKGWLCEPEYDITKTQATINGGVAERLNAFIDVRGCKVIANL